jgi:hypothetical protein
MAADLLHREAQLSGHFLHRDAPVVFEPFFRSGHGALLLFGDRFIIDWSIADGCALGIGHDFEQPNHGVQLTRIELIEQLMGVLFVLCFSFQRLSAPGAPRGGSFKDRFEDMCLSYRISQ